ncbi:hypothetical protein [cyanobacterium endosymbiont of Rhopalodia gibberula]|uniref:hypothetical protein n=1 Tax=cyanobacterium endosymbiont of Rhopalodia gibberula TaxID=1763363 RepID=UPI0011AB777D|nr:hypothetical protein [cyanobacterium endosymbiont of Rhopalodia gibberula]
MMGLKYCRCCRFYTYRVANVASVNDMTMKNIYQTFFGRDLDFCYGLCVFEMGIGLSGFNWLCYLSSFTHYIENISVYVGWFTV